MKCNSGLKLVDSFLANVPILYPLKTPENLFTGDTKYEHYSEMV